MPSLDYLDTIRAGAASKALKLDIPPTPDQWTPLHRRLIDVWGDGVRQWDAAVCRVCAKRLPPCEPLDFMGAPLVATVCDACAQLVADHYEPTGSAISPKTPSWWRDTCPPLYQRLVAHGLPDHCDREAYARVARWTPDETHGIIALGESGAGKTTSLWALARNLEESGIKPVMVTAVELARALGKSAFDLRHDHWLSGCRVLIVDDLGKERLTPGVSAMLWELVETRYAHERPMVISTRFTGEEFEARFGEKSKEQDGTERYILGRDIRRRLAQTCKPIRFRSAPPQA
jgi:hypothetical protein